MCIYIYMYISLVIFITIILCDWIDDNALLWESTPCFAHGTCDLTAWRVVEVVADVPTSRLDSISCINRTMLQLGTWIN